MAKSLIEELSYPLKWKSDRQPYHQYLKRYEDGTVGFSQMQFIEVMQSAEEILPEEKLLDLIQCHKKVIIQGLDANMCNSRVYEKYKWLKDEFNDLTVLLDDEQGELVDFRIVEPMERNRGHNIHFSYVNEE